MWDNICGVTCIRHRLMSGLCTYCVENHFEKPVSAKETGDSCNFIRIKRECPLGRIPMGLLS